MTVDEILADHEDAVLALQTGGATSKSEYERREQALADHTRARLEGVLGGTWREHATLTEIVDKLDADPSEALTDAQLADAATLRPGLDTLTVDQLVSRAAAITEPVSAFAYLQALSARTEYIQMSNPLNPNLYHGSGSSTRYRCADGTTYIGDATGTVHSVLDKHVAELTANGFSNRHPRDLANPNNGNQAAKWGNG